jgi:folylpolyglutamate synthase/dihydropteroate synthase
MILDGAHNVAGAKTLVEYLRSYRQKFTFIIGMQKNKEIEKFVKILKPLASRFIVVRSSNPFAASEEFVSRHIKDCRGNPLISNDLRNAFSLAKRSGSPVCVTGSLYLVGDLLSSTRT